jgi:hypothetical protein
MISLRDDSTEPDYEALAARLAAETGISWLPADVKMWSELFRMFKPDSESDETDR